MAIGPPINCTAERAASVSIFGNWESERRAGRVSSV